MSQHLLPLLIRLNTHINAVGFAPVGDEDGFTGLTGQISHALAASAEAAAQIDDLLTAVRREASDMGLALWQTELHLEPAVGLLAGHKALLPKPVQSNVGLPPLLPQGLIRQRPHGQMAVSVGGHIGVTGGKGVQTGSLQSDIGCGKIVHHCGECAS